MAPLGRHVNPAIGPNADHFMEIATMTLPTTPLAATLYRLQLRPTPAADWQTLGDYAMLTAAADAFAVAEREQPDAYLRIMRVNDADPRHLDAAGLTLMLQSYPRSDY